METIAAYWENEDLRVCIALACALLLVVALCFLGIEPSIALDPESTRLSNIAGPLPSGSIVDSDITTDTVWTEAGSPYLVKFSASGIEVAEGVTLIIEPGVTVRFEQYATLIVFGTLRASGTAAKPITFTGTSPTPGWWLGISVQGTDAWHRNPGSVFRYVTIEYGLNNLSIMAASAHVSHSILRYASSAGLSAAYASGTVVECSQIVGNSEYGINNILGGAVLAFNNWWGAGSGPEHKTCNPGGTGDLVADEYGDVVFLPFLTSPEQEPAPVTPSQADILAIAPQRWFAPADGVTRIWVKITLRDGTGLPLPGRTVHLLSDLGAAVDGGVTDWKGETLAYVTSGTAGDAKLSALLKDKGTCEFVRSSPAQVTFTEYADDALMPGAAAPYMNGRLEVKPMPIMRGVPTTVSARLTNPNSYPIEVNATLGYAQLGLGLTFGDIGTVTDFRIAPRSDGTIQVPWTPLISGNYCLRLEYASRPAGGTGAALQASGWAQTNLSIEPGPLASGATGGDGDTEEPEAEPGSEKDLILKAKATIDRINDGQMALDAVTSPENIVGLAIPNLLMSYIVDWNLEAWSQVLASLVDDPPRQDYDTYATLEEYTFTPLVPGDDLSPARAAAANALTEAILDLTARLRAATLSFDRYSGAAEANDLFWASQQAAALLTFKEDAGSKMDEVADRIETLLEVLRDEGVADMTVQVSTVQAYQARLQTEGFGSEEIQAAQSIGLSDEEIETIRQERIAADPAELAGSVMTGLQEIADSLRPLSTVLQTPPNFQTATSSRALGPASGASRLARIFTSVSTFRVGNPLSNAATVELRIRPIDLPSDWMVTVSPLAIALGPGEQAMATATIRPGAPAVQGTQPRLAIEGYVDDELIGGIALDVMVPQKASLGPRSMVYLPLAVRGDEP
jgi:hypothetical protein